MMEAQFGAIKLGLATDLDGTAVDAVFNMAKAGAVQRGPTNWDTPSSDLGHSPPIRAAPADQSILWFTRVPFMFSKYHHNEACQEGDGDGAVLSAMHRVAGRRPLE